MPMRPLDQLPLRHARAHRRDRLGRAGASEARRLRELGLRRRRRGRAAAPRRVSARDPLALPDRPHDRRDPPRARRARSRVDPPHEPHDPAPLVALVGNPNAGKSALFNALTGARQKVGNYPGVTVERHVGAAGAADGRPVELVDLPGAYSLDPASPDEEVTRDVVLGRAGGRARARRAGRRASTRPTSTITCASRCS